MLLPYRFCASIGGETGAERSFHRGGACSWPPNCYQEQPIRKLKEREPLNIPKTYDQLDQWKTVMFLYNSALKAINTKIEILNNEFIHIYNYNVIIFLRIFIIVTFPLKEKLVLRFLCAVFPYLPLDFHNYTL